MKKLLLLFLLAFLAVPIANAEESVVTLTQPSTREQASSCILGLTLWTMRLPSTGVTASRKSTTK